MLWYAMNFKSIFDTVDYLKGLGYHNNSFIIGPLLNPIWQDVRQLPDNILDDLMIELNVRIKKEPGFLIEDSYRNMLTHLAQPFDSNLEALEINLNILGMRRGLDSRLVFPEMYKCLLS